MSQYKIEWSEKKTSAKGTEYYRVTVTDAEGKSTTDVAVFSSFADYANIQAGREVTGRLTSKEYNGKQSYTLENEVSQPKPFQPRTGAIKEAQERKEHSIEKAQTNKELGIKVSSTMRDAVLIATTLINNSHVDNSPGDMKDLILHWRKWLWENFDKEDKDFNPF